MNGIRRIRAILNLDPENTVSVLSLAYACGNGMEKDPGQYSAPVPPVAVLLDAAAKLDTAEQVSATRVKGGAAARNVQRQVVVGMLETECSYVQTLCDAVPPEKAVTIIQAVGMTVALAPTHTTPILRATVGMPSGTVDLVASVTALVGKTKKKTFFNWQWTTDGGKTFNNAPSTPHAKTAVAGLTPLTTVGFRVSVTSGKGTGDWSQIVSVLVL
jgi:hypothetical protein